MASMAVGARPVARVGEPLFENSGFEKGDLTQWTTEGDAFKFQPVKSDKLRLQGEFLIATEAKNTGAPGTPEGRQGAELRDMTSGNCRVNRRVI